MLDSLIRISRQELLDLDPASTTVITVNNRMAIQLKKTLIEANRSHTKVFELAQIQPWSNFVESLNEQVIFVLGELPASKQLSHFASLLYWEAVLEEQQLITLNLTKLAKVLADAHSLQLEWAIEVDGTEETPEYTEYKNIREHYLQRLRDRDVIDGPLRDQWLLNQLEQCVEFVEYSAEDEQQGSLDFAPTYKSKLVSEQIVLLGFNELSAFQQALLKHCHSLGAKLYVLEPEASQVAGLQVRSAHSRSQELAAAVAWAKQKLNDNPQGHFAIIDPLLQTEVDTVRRYLHEQIQESGLKTDLLYNVAIGRALSDWSIVRSALAWLGLFIKLEQNNRIATHVLGESLLLAQEGLMSNYADELTKIDRGLRRESRISYSKNQVLKFFYDISDEFSALVETATEIFSNASSLSLNQWLQKFKHFLAVFQFPGLPKLSSVQYQVCHAFEQALKNATALSPVLDKMTAAEAFYLFERFCKQQLFQPQRAATARLDVLGMLEAEAAKWDAVWILSMQDDVLPTVPKPNPLIPKTALQRVGAPRSDHQREFVWAELMLRSLLETAPEINISWHAFSGEMPTKASPLLAQYLAEDQWRDLNDEALEGADATQSVETATEVELEYLSDNYGPKVDGLLKGGSRLIDLQAINPQWAFATYRLHMEEFCPYPRYELDRLQRGNFIHAALEEFWRDVQDQVTLKAMDQATLNAKISEVVEKCAKSELLFDSKALLELEKNFAKSQLYYFLSMEQERDHSFRVEEVEKSAEVMVSNIKLRVKVDRIDYLDNDSFVYLDYKTGNLPNYKNSWYRERPIDLQLPLYATYGDYPTSEISGVGFAGLKPNAMGFAGIGSVDWSLQPKGRAKSGVEVKDAAGFEQQLQIWKDVILGLAQEIADGYAANCYSNINDMRYCEVLPFLRLGQKLDEEENQND
jgi:probable DNA repair protein